MKRGWGVSNRDTPAILVLARVVSRAYRYARERSIANAAGEGFRAAVLQLYCGNANREMCQERNIVSDRMAKLEQLRIAGRLKLGPRNSDGNSKRSWRLPSPVRKSVEQLCWPDLPLSPHALEHACEGGRRPAKERSCQADVPRNQDDTLTLLTGHKPLHLLFSATTT